MPTYDLFSNRDNPLPDVFQYDVLPTKFRNQVFWVWRRLFNNTAYGKFWQILCEEHGEPHLHSPRLPPHQDIIEFLLCEQSRTDLTLAAIELSLTESLKWADGMFSLRGDEGVEGASCFAMHAIGANAGIASVCQDAVATINHRFRENGLGYEYRQECHKLVRIDSLILHQEAVVPALNLLTDPAFKTGEYRILGSPSAFPRWAIS